MLHSKHVAVQCGHPLSALNRQIKVADRIANERLDLGPEEDRIAFRDVGGILVAKTLVHPDLGELMKQCIELPESVREAFARVMIAI